VGRLFEWVRRHDSTWSAYSYAIGLRPSWFTPLYVCHSKLRAMFPYGCVATGSTNGGMLSVETAVECMRGRRAWYMMDAQNVVCEDAIEGLLVSKEFWASPPARMETPG
jgi:hypothetical protein